MIKVVWLCAVSNSEIREKLRLKTSPIEPILWKAVHRKYEQGIDGGIWITNGINEVKNMHDVEVHIVSPCRNLEDKRQDFCIGGVNYHFFRDENSSLSRKVLRYLFTRNSSKFKKNRREICQIIKEVNPDLVHIIGAENPQYSLALLDLPREIPTILQLQALLASTTDKVEGELKKNYTYKGELEKQLIVRADYVGTCVSSYIDFIRNQVSNHVRIINTTLAMAQQIDMTESFKEFDFVHFAAVLSPSKATDIAIEAFGEAYKRHPEITLDLIGSCPEGFRQQLDKRIEELGIKKSVTFEGRLLTHDDVIRQMRKSRFALLPLKISIVPNTLHEAMANGLPLLTTVTAGTPLLNKKRQSALISEMDDYKDIANNMCRLLEDSSLADSLRVNAAKTEYERANNHDIICHWVDAYGAILRAKKEGEDILHEYLL